MKILNYKKLKISKKYRRSASAYKKLAVNMGVITVSFSYDHLIEQYVYESLGEKEYFNRYSKLEPDQSINGYTYGKHLYDILIADITSDINEGYFCKYEFIKDYSLPYKVRNYVKNLKNVGVIFPHKDYERKYK